MQPNLNLTDGLLVSFTYSDGLPRIGTVVGDPKRTNNNTLTLVVAGCPHPKSYSWSKMQSAPREIV